MHIHPLFTFFPLMLQDNLHPLLIYTPMISSMTFRGGTLGHCCVRMKLMACNDNGKKRSHC